MRTQLLGRVDIDEARLQQELAIAESFSYSDAYSDYVYGGPWRSCMLWAPSGDDGDGLVANYDHTMESMPTRYGKQLPYLAAIIKETFDVENLNFVRLAVISNSVIIPHRDLLELEQISRSRRNTHRVHVPLATNDNCFFAEENMVFHMAMGEVWALDAAREHSAASFSSAHRIHLILDFIDVPDPATLVRLPRNDRDCVRQYYRPKLTAAEREALLALANIIDVDNYHEVFAIIIKTHFRKDGGVGFVWQTILDIARRNGDPLVAEQITRLHEHFLIERGS